MNQKRSGLGRGLSALLKDSNMQMPMQHKVTEQATLMQCPLTSLVAGRFQPRRHFDEQALSELAISIQTQGLLQPLIVREIAQNHYEIIAGERRWRACQIAGLRDVPVVVRQVNDETAHALALIENMQREDLSVIEKAYAIQKLTEEFKLTHQSIASLLSVSRASISNLLRLLNLNQAVLSLLEKGELDMGHARCLLTLDPAMQIKAAQHIVAKQLSVRAAEEWVARIKTELVPEARVQAAYPVYVHEKLTALKTHLQTSVKLKSNDSGRGTLTIHYSDWSSLDQILSQFLAAPAFGQSASNPHDLSQGLLDNAINVQLLDE